MMLADYLRAAMRTPFAWGVQDCCTFFADWAILRGNPDPMAFVRGRYTTGRVARRIIRNNGGLLGAAQRGMIDALIPEVDEPRLGDLAVIERPTPDRTNVVCAIYGGERWVSRGIRGIDSGPARPLMIWRP